MEFAIWGKSGRIPSGFIPSGAGVVAVDMARRSWSPLLSSFVVAPLARSCCFFYASAAAAALQLLPCWWPAMPRRRRGSLLSSRRQLQSTIALALVARALLPLATAASVLIHPLSDLFLTPAEMPPPVSPSLHTLHLLPHLTSSSFHCRWFPSPSGAAVVRLRPSMAVAVSGGAQMMFGRSGVASSPLSYSPFLPAALTPPSALPTRERDANEEFGGFIIARKSERSTCIGGCLLKVEFCRWWSEGGGKKGAACLDTSYARIGGVVLLK